jgi:hypothetical protein
MTIYFKNGMTLEVSKELGESIMSNIVRENNGYVYLSKLLQAVYLDNKPCMALNLNEIVYIQ